MVRARTQGQPNIVVRVLAVKAEKSHDQWAPHAEIVQQMMNRPHLHARLSTCLPKAERSSRLQLRYFHDGQLDDVTGGPGGEVRECVRRVLNELEFGQAINTEPIDPRKPYSEPGYVVVLELTRRD